jgi:hypothetical protein
MARPSPRWSLLMVQGLPLPDPKFSGGSAFGAVTSQMVRMSLKTSPLSVMIPHHGLPGVKSLTSLPRAGVPKAIPKRPDALSTVHYQ